ncbi:hypothetical protein QJS66_04075 [Kocuria rhizophila]|nr:hypothetical protein QJS66_04075 [Kocuria rhizophila]
MIRRDRGDHRAGRRVRGRAGGGILGRTSTRITQNSAEDERSESEGSREQQEKLFRRLGKAVTKSLD